MKKILQKLAVSAFPTWMKERAELQYWRERKREEASLSNEHYKLIYTTWLKLSYEDFSGRSVLDIGCGPRGSLEWAQNASRRVGLDPLAGDYLKLGASSHSMEYVTAGSELMPFEDGEFDIICSINSLDHVTSLSETLSEIKRVCCSKGLLLIATEVNHDPTVTEPQVFGWDVVEQLLPEFEVEMESRFEVETHDLWRNVREGRIWDSNNVESRPGLLLARLRKVL